MNSGQKKSTNREYVGNMWIQNPLKTREMDFGNIVEHRLWTKNSTFGPRSNYPETPFRSSRRDESELKWVYKWVFEAFINHMIMIIRKHFWSTFISPTGPKVSFSIVWTWTKSGFWINKSRDHLFRRAIGLDQKWVGMHMRHVTISSNSLNWTKSWTTVYWSGLRSSWS